LALTYLLASNSFLINGFEGFRRGLFDLCLCCNVLFFSRTGQNMCPYSAPILCECHGVDTTMINLVLEGYYIPSHTCIHVGFTVVFFAASVFQHCKSRGFIKHPLLMIRSNESFALDKP
jgi:hypothetical protein